MQMIKQVNDLRPEPVRAKLHKKESNFIIEPDIEPESLI